MKIQLTRRKLFAAGAAASVAAILPHGNSQTANMSVSSAGPSIIPPSDSSYASLLDKHFPGLSSDPKFTAVAPLTALLNYENGPKLFGFSLVWRVTTSAGDYETPMFHFSRAGSRRRKQAGIAALSGTRTVLRAGQVVLVSPFFAWSSERFHLGTHSWKRLGKNAEPGSFLLSEVLAGARVSVVLDSALTRKQVVAGPDTYKFGTRFSVRRNGEHDESLAVYKMLSVNASDAEIQNTLNSHAAARRPAKSGNYLWYMLARRSQAGLLQECLQKFGRDKLLTLVTRAVHQPKTVLQKSA